MKKIWMILLMACSVYALTACSEKEDGPKDLNPVTVTEMAKMAYRGEDFVIKGTGFDPSAKFALKDEAGKETPLEIVGEITATQVRLDIPTDLEAGKYTVILTQAGSWELGEITLAGILNIVWPAELHIGKTMTIAGEGFAQTAKVYLESEDGTRSNELEIKNATDKELVCQVPADFQHGKLCTIVLVQDEKEYKSAKVQALVLKRLKSIEQLIAGYYEYTEWGESGPTDSIWIEPTTILTEFIYNGEQLKQVKNPNDDIVNITYPDENTIKVGSEEESADILFMLDGKQVRSCDMFDEVAYEEVTYTWEYVDNYLEKITSTNEFASSACAFTFVDGNLKDLELNGINSFEYGDKFVYGLDMAAWIIAQNDYLLPYAIYLDLLGKKSLNLPVKYYPSSGEGSGVDLEYEYDAQGYVTKLTIPALFEWDEAKVYEFIWE